MIGFFKIFSKRTMDRGLVDPVTNLAQDVLKAQRAMANMTSPAAMSAKRTMGEFLVFLKSYNVDTKMSQETALSIDALTAQGRFGIIFNVFGDIVKVYNANIGKVADAKVIVTKVAIIGCILGNAAMAECDELKSLSAYALEFLRSHIGFSIVCMHESMKRMNEAYPDVLDMDMFLEGVFPTR